MNKKRLFVFVLAVMFLASADVCARKKQKIKVLGGVPIKGVGIVVDAGYDSRFNNMVPGYKIVSVAIVNESFNIIPLEVDRDKWSIKVKGKRKKIRGIHSLRSAKPKIWAKLPEGVKKIEVYPMLLPIGAKQVIDLFFEDKVPVEDFSEVIIEIASLNKEIFIKPRK